MAIETDLTVSPYFESDQEQNYYKVLFKPSVPVQVRELNQLQTMLQNQIEKFGDNILKRGTIVRGCNFNFYENYPYIKIRDNETNGAEAILSRYNKMVIENASGVKAYVHGFEDGYEASDPDLKTLFIRYNQSGSKGNTDTFSSGDILTVTNTKKSIYGIDINNGGTGYTNNDTFLFLSAIVVSDANAVGFAAGHTIIQETTNAQATIAEVNTSILAKRTVLKIKPLSIDLSTGNTSAWNFVSEPTGYDIRDTTSNSYATVLDIVGENANASVVTDSTGRITSYIMNNTGSGYYAEPQVGVISATGSGANIVAENYLAKITVATTANSVGTGYAFGVSGGVIYQKGYFINVDEQHVVVSKYDPTPNNLSVGFNTIEEVIDANEDTNLLDNALGTRNYTAPGADRLKLTPELIVINTDDARANTDFFAIVEFSEGIPYKQNQTTQYSKINDEMSKRTSEQSGDFVLDRFDVATTAVANQSMDSQQFNIVIDPGLAYIEGYRVSTLGNYTMTAEKGIDLGSVQNNMSTSLDYAKYVEINNYLGSFPVTTGGIVELHSSPVSAYSNTTIIESGNIPSPGSKIGEARVRSIKLIDGVPGTASARYHLYLFDLNLMKGFNFKATRSIYDPLGVIKAVADVVTKSIRSYANGTPIVEAVLEGTFSSSGESRSKLLFPLAVESPLSVNSVTYSYLRRDSNTPMSNTGNLQITLTGSEYFLTTGELTDSSARDFIFVPKQNLQANVKITGNVNSNGSIANIVGTGTSFLSDLREGDYVLVSANTSGGTNTRRVVNIVNNTFLQLDSPPSDVSNNNAYLYRYFPKNVPLPFGTRAGMVITVNSDARVLEANIGTRLAGAGNSDIHATFPVRAIDVPASQKTPLRSRFVKICVANNSTGFKLTGYGNNKYVATTSGSNTATGSGLTYFSAGDSVVVESAAGINWATGNYKKPELVVVAANATHITFDNQLNFTSANVTIRKAGNLEGPWCLGVPDVFRLRKVYHANTSTVNSNSSDVTRNFVIDHNQTLSYYGLSYLYKERNSNFIVRPGDYLLVEYDCFTSSGTFHHINSYVESNSALRFATDSKLFANLTSTAMDVNTFEIPIVKKVKFTYDLIKYLDFRPYVTKTANTSVVSGTDPNITINPSEVITFDSTDKKFPIPGSLAEYNARGFLSRIDSVLVNRKNEFRVKKGDPKPTVNQAIAPEISSKAMLLTNLVIPAYPNVTQLISNNTNTIIDTNVVNENLLRDRVHEKAILRQQISDHALDTYQPYRYTMADIGNLERRIRDLEYYVSLTLVELNIKDKKIPSTVDPTIDRFKFGFFTDNYNSYNLSEVLSQEFDAEVVEGRVIPSHDCVLVDGTPDIIDQEYEPFLLISQTTATVDKDEDPTVTVTTKYLSANQSDDKQRGDGTSKKYYTQIAEVAMASELPASYNKDVKMYVYNYSAKDRHEIYQGPDDNGPWTLAASSSDARQMTGAEAKFMLDKTNKKNKFSEDQLKKFQTNGTFTTYGCIIEWPHNPAKGQNYQIRSKKGDGSVVWDWLLEYPIGGTDPDDKDPCDTPAPGKYTGVMSVIKSKSVEVVSNKAMKNNPDELRAIKIRVTGLKPNTKHKFYVQGKNQTESCDTSITPIPDKFNMKKETYDEWLDNVGAGKQNIMTGPDGQVTFLLYLVEDPATFSGQEVLVDKGKEKLTNDNVKANAVMKKNGKYTYEVWDIYKSVSTYSKTANFTFEIYNNDKSSYAYTSHNVTITYQKTDKRFVYEDTKTGKGAGAPTRKIP